MSSVFYAPHHIFRSAASFQHYAYAYQIICKYAIRVLVMRCAFNQRFVICPRVIPTQVIVHPRSLPLARLPFPIFGGALEVMLIVRAGSRYSHYASSIGKCMHMFVYSPVFCVKIWTLSTQGICSRYQVRRRPRCPERAMPLRPQYQVVDVLYCRTSGSGG